MELIMDWRLGLDLGTNSLGWAVFRLDNDEPVDLADIGVRIFSDGREPAGEGRIGESLAVARRMARGTRKNIRRRKQRKKALLKQLAADDLFPKDKEKRLEMKMLNPYKLRTEALDRKLNKEELGRVLYHLGVRRGFKSNRKEEPIDNQAKKEAEGNAARTESLYDKMKEVSARTLGEFLYLTNQKNNPGQKTDNTTTFGSAQFSGKAIRFTAGNAEYYPVRKMYENEFDLIRNKQEQYYPNIHWDEVKIIIITQRPLQKQERGKCQFMTKQERAYKALPSIHHFRMLQEINNLVMYDELNNPVELTKKDKQLAFDLLDTKKEVKFDEFRKKLNNKYRFNLESEIRPFLKGNETACAMRRKNYFDEIWDTLPATEQDDLVDFLIDAETDEEVLNILGSYSLSDEQKKNIAKYNFGTGTASVCKQFAQECNTILHNEWILYHEAVEKMGYNHSEEKVEKANLLPYYGKVLTGSTIGSGKSDKEDEPEKKYGRIGNPTVHVALNQVKTVVNALIKQYGKPKQIVVEVSRDLKASREKKEDIYKKQTENAKVNRLINKNISDANPDIKYPNRADRLKFKLWQELGVETMSRKCVYCGKVISASELFSQNIELEHILPYSRTLMDGESNLTLAHSKCNRDKQERSPWEAFSGNPSGYNWEEICLRAADLPKRKAQRFSSDAMKNIEDGFIDRQLTDNAYLSKVSRRYLKTICDDVWVAAGGLTKLLRDKWDIDKILKRKIGDAEIMHFNLDEKLIGQYKKNRYDHRHHALDAFVIGSVDRSLVQEVARLNALKRKNSLQVPPHFVQREELIEKVKNIVVSFKPDHGVEGKLSKETALGKIKQEIIIPIASLKEEMIPDIKADKVREDFNKLLKEKSFKDVVKELKDTYPVIKIYESIFVSRSPITSLKERKNIEDIIDKKIKKMLYQFIDAHPELDFKKALEQFTQETKIHKVRCKTFAQSPIVIAPRVNNPLSTTRYYNPLDYFAAIVWEIPPLKEGKLPTYEAQYVRRSQADKKGNPIEDKPHPAAKKICILHKDDYIEYSENGKWLKARIAGYDAGSKRVDIRPIYAVNFNKDWIIATNETMLEKEWKESSNHNYITVNVLFGKKSARYITVNPIGKVFRKRL